MPSSSKDLALASMVLAAMVVIMPQAAFSEDAKRHHAMSLMGTPKYGPDFKHFDYVNPNAPKGGRIRQWARGSFDTLNHFATVKGRAAFGLVLIYDKLMARSLEEPGTEYSLIAEWASYPNDFSSVTFKLKETARWHDGKPITADDVVYSLNTLKKIDPQRQLYYKNVVKVEKLGEHKVKFTFDVKGNRELPHIVGELTIIPKHYWTGKDKDGNQRDPGKSTLEPPLASGPYKIKSVTPGRTIIYERVKDYWAKDLPVNVGLYNFDEIQVDYYRDQTIALQAFKADQLDFFQVTSSKDWATALNIKAIKKGWVKKQIVPLKSVEGMQAFVFNIRRKKFTDPRVRQAFNLAFDFEWSNKNLFYGQYKRQASFFDNSELASRGLPEGKELEILNSVKKSVAEELFTTEYKNPLNKTPQDFRRNLRKASKLFKEAGWAIKNGKLTDSKGETFNVEFLLVSPLFERVVLPYTQNLKRLGIGAKVRTVDVAQYKRRLDKFDYDIIVGSFPQSFSPGNEQRFFWGSKAADQAGSFNLIGIKNPAVDKIVDNVIFAKDRAELIAATRALDRVLLWNHYVVPQWFIPYARISYWDRFGHPKSLAVLSPNCDAACQKKATSKENMVITLGVGQLSTWWYDKTSAEKLAAIR